MNRVAARRVLVYDHCQASRACQSFFLASSNEEAYVAYYNSMYLLQDSTESLLQHRQVGFSNNPLSAYLEFWGVLQAAIIQQDSIAELHEVIVGKPLDAVANKLRAWLSVRELRNVCAGHPAKRDRPRSSPLTRTFMGRSFGDYKSITYEQWQQGVGQSHQKVQLGALLDSYASEAEGQLAFIHAAMKARWP